MRIHIHSFKHAQRLIIRKVYSRWKEHTSRGCDATEVFVFHSVIIQEKRNVQFVIPQSTFIMSF